jgi:hypothetical protein
VVAGGVDNEPPIGVGDREEGRGKMEQRGQQKLSSTYGFLESVRAFAQMKVTKPNFDHVQKKGSQKGTHVDRL